MPPVDHHDGLGFMVKGLGFRGASPSSKRFAVFRQCEDVVPPVDHHDGDVGRLDELQLLGGHAVAHHRVQLALHSSRTAASGDICEPQTSFRISGLGWLITACNWPFTAAEQRPQVMLVSPNPKP